MKGRSFLLALVVVAMVLLTLALGFWWAMARQSPLRIMDRSLELPRAARFMPTDAALTLHWLVDPRQLPAYAQAVAPVRQRQLVHESTRQLRDGAFALAGLDFNTELAGWIGPEISFAVLDAPAQQSSEQPREGWVLALSSRDQDGAKRFLQRFWQTRSLTGTDLQISSYRGIGLISGRGALIGRNPQPLATALIDDDLLLLASGRGVLEQALDVSQLKDQHQLGNEMLQRQVAGFGKGVALMTASPRALQRWMDLPEDVAAREDLSGLVAVLQPDGAELVMNALLLFKDRFASSSWPPLSDLSPEAGGRGLWLAQLQNPARLLNPDDSHPLVQWLGPLLQDQLRERSAAAAVVRLDAGPLLWQQQADGWLLTSRRDQPEQQAVDAELQSAGLSRSELKEEGEQLQVWTRLVRRRGRNSGLDAQLAVVQVRTPSLDWWAETLIGLAHRSEVKGLQARLQQLRSLQSDDQPTHALLLDSRSAQAVLRQWSTWSRLSVMAGQPVQERVQGLALSVGVDNQLDDGGTALPLHARLSLG